MWDGNSPCPSQQSLWKQQRGQLKWRAAIEAGPCGVVNMVHHGYDLGFGQRGERAASWEDIANKFMIPFQSPLLP